MRVRCRWNSKDDLAWQAQHPGERTPLAAFMTLVTFAMWTIASLGCTESAYAILAGA
jgi:hypothetical protein